MSPRSLELVVDVVGLVVFSSVFELKWILTFDNESFESRISIFFHSSSVPE